jgi:S-adenosylmethionine-diacylglycerol 3-amino-3-carboxypropyl transferase
MDSGQDLVLGAVKQSDASKKQGILQKLFAVWFDAFVYNQIWEDPRVDIKALQLNENSRILTISSGGCNALNYLLENPQSVTAVDLNRHHIFLLNLKIAALRSLPTHEDFFAFFGFGKDSKNLENFEKHIAPELDAQTLNFWENASFFGRLSYGKRINFFEKDGLYDHSRNGYFLKFFHKIAPFLGSRPAEILKAKTPGEQAELYEKHIEPFFNSFLIKIVGKMPVTMFGLGIPPQQYEELKKDLTGGETVIDVYEKRVKRLAVDFPIEENYFAWQAFARKYDAENRRAIPDYLRAKNYELLKSRAHKIKTKIGSVTDELKRQPQNTFNRFVFLDAQDWMNSEAIGELWQSIAEKAEKGSRIIFRTAGADSPIEKNLPESLREKFFYEKDSSEKLFKQDRASIYGGFHLYILK